MSEPVKECAVCTKPILLDDDDSLRATGAVWVTTGNLTHAHLCCNRTCGEYMLWAVRACEVEFARFNGAER